MCPAVSPICLAEKPKSIDLTAGPALVSIAWVCRLAVKHSDDLRFYLFHLGPELIEQKPRRHSPCLVIRGSTWSCVIALVSHPHFVGLGMILKSIFMVCSFRGDTDTTLIATISLYVYFYLKGPVCMPSMDLRISENISCVTWVYA